MIADAEYERAFVEERDFKSPGFNSLNERLWNDRSFAKKWVRLAALHHRGVFLEDHLPGFQPFGDSLDVLIQQRQTAETEALTYRGPRVVCSTAVRRNTSGPATGGLLSSAVSPNKSI